MLARLWAVLDPAVDALPAAEVLERLLSRIREQFGVSAAALTLDTGDRFGTPAGDPARPAASERIEIDVQDGLGRVGSLELASDGGAPAPTSASSWSSSPPGSGARWRGCGTSARARSPSRACAPRTARRAGCTGSRPP